MLCRCFSCAFVIATTSLSQGLLVSHPHECDSVWSNYTDKDEPELFSMATKVKQCLLALEGLPEHSNDTQNALGPDSNGFLQPSGQLHFRKPNIPLHLDGNAREVLLGFGGKHIALVGDSTMRYAYGALTCVLMAASAPEKEEASITAETLQRLRCNSDAGVYCTRIWDTGVNVSYVWMQNLSMKGKALHKLSSMDLPTGSVLMLNHGVGADGLFGASSRSVAKSTFKAYVEAIMSAFLAFATNRSVHIVWRETVPQHFPTDSGGYPTSWSLEDKHSLRCAPYTPDRDRSGFNIRNVVANSVMRRLGVPVVRVFPEFCSAWQEHLRPSDCTHLSFDGNMVLVDLMMRGLRARSETVFPP